MRKGFLRTLTLVLVALFLVSCSAPADFVSAKRTSPISLSNPVSASAVSTAPQSNLPLSVSLWSTSPANWKNSEVTASFLDGAFASGALDYQYDSVENEIVIALRSSKTSYDVTVVAALPGDISKGLPFARNLGYHNMLFGGRTLVTAVPINTGEEIYVFIGGGNDVAKSCYRLDLTDTQAPFLVPAEVLVPAGYTFPSAVTLYADEQMRNTVLHVNSTVIRYGQLEFRFSLDQEMVIYDGDDTFSVDFAEELNRYIPAAIRNKGTWHLRPQKAGVQNGFLTLMGVADLISQPNDFFATLSFLLRINISEKEIACSIASSDDYFIDVAWQNEYLLLTRIGPSSSPITAELEVEALSPANLVAAKVASVQPVALYVDTQAKYIEILDDGTVEYHTISLIDGAPLTVQLNPFTKTVAWLPQLPTVDTSVAHNPYYMLGNWWLPISQLPNSGRRCNFNADGTFAFKGGVAPDETDFLYFGGRWYVQDGILYLVILCEELWEDGEQILYVYSEQEAEVRANRFEWVSLYQGELNSAVFYDDVALYHEGYWSGGDQQDWFDAAVQRLPGRYIVK